MKVCAITMVRDDLFFIKKWIKYYGNQIGEEHLFILLHGNSQEIRALSHRANFINLPARDLDTIGSEKFNRDRFKLINELANNLQNYYEFVIVVDVDEFLMVDPGLNRSLVEYLSMRPEPVTLTPIGLDVIQHLDFDNMTIDLEAPILKQRPHCKIEPLYCKPVVTNKKIKRSNGNHAANDPNLRWGEGLFLFHLKWMDRYFAIGNHSRRETLKTGDERSLEIFPSDLGLNSKRKESINMRYDRIRQLRRCDRFDFTHEKKIYNKSWRRRRFLFQVDFWRCVANLNLSAYSFHYRFDLVRFESIHIIPERFRDAL